MKYRAFMKVNRSTGAWIWVAMAALSLVSLARVQSGVENARAYADPVIKFFAAAHQADADAPARAQRATSRTHTGASGIGLDLLAVYFVGLVAPLIVQSVRDISCLQRRPATLFLGDLFQRPPPVFFA